MLEVWERFVRWFRKEELSAILTVFDKAQTRLDKYLQVLNEEMGANQAQVARLTAENVMHQANANHANMVSENLKKLTSPPTPVAENAVYHIEGSQV